MPLRSALRRPLLCWLSRLRTVAVTVPIGSLTSFIIIWRERRTKRTVRVRIRVCGSGLKGFEIRVRSRFPQSFLPSPRKENKQVVMVLHDSNGIV